ncbi:MAG: UPF0079 ATP-binding protein [Parcubacteria group bacterium Licking1014_17]|nr:MAG: UPF0079 ATP-binding protein [Parcubacteria group bacterium Licking1014_17]
MEFLSKSVRETKKIAGDFARKISKSKPGKWAAVIALSGELGAGKTTFTQGFAKALGIKKHITSPTFVLMKKYELALKFKPYENLVHIDAYRLSGGDDLKTIGVEELMENSVNIILIEWAERVKDILPKSATIVKISHVDENTRKIFIL